jgi:hypothetical protein
LVLNEDPDTMLVRSIHSKGHFRWKKRHDVFLSEVLWGERVGLLPIDERWFTIYFAQFPIARFDSRERRVVPVPASAGFSGDGAGDGEASPSPAPPPLNHPWTKCQVCPRSKLSGMFPAIQISKQGACSQLALRR